MPQWRSYITSVVHRDLKPQNIGIKVNADGQFYAVLADFGLAYCLLRNSFPNAGLKLVKCVAELKYLNISREIFMVTK